MQKEKKNSIESKIKVQRANNKTKKSKKKKEMKRKRQ